MKSTRRSRNRIAVLALAPLMTLLLFSNGIAFASSSQRLQFVITGGVVDAGTQTYNVEGGRVAFASVLGFPVVPPSSKLSYSLAATVSGLSVSGAESLKLTGKTTSGVDVTVTASGSISDTLGVPFPLGCSGSGCTSEIPFQFDGTSMVTVTIGGSTVISTTLVAEFESPYLNPFGRPIVLAFAPLDPPSSPIIVIAATYTLGSIHWQNVILGGTVSGSGMGVFAVSSNSLEDLVSGVEHDSGAIAFTMMTPATLNGAGTFHGLSRIPTAGAMDCSPLGLPGTCLKTGLNSHAVFDMSSAAGMIHGTSSTTWSVPALGFASSISATVSKA